MYGRTGQTTPHSRRKVRLTAEEQLRTSIYHCEQAIEKYGRQAELAEAKGEWFAAKISRQMVERMQARLDGLRDRLDNL